MPTKNFSGSLINYGTALPDPSTTPDGALFFKFGGADEGLYLFSFISDINLGTFGTQSGQGWVPLTGASSSIDADTLGGQPPSYYQVGSPILDGVIDLNAATGIVVKTGASTFATRSISGDSTITITPAAGDGVSGNIAISVNQGNLSINSIGGTLGVSKGGTGLTAAVDGGIAYGATTSSIAFSAAGTSGHLLQSGGTGAPSWIDPSSLTVGTANYANTAGTASTAGSVTNAVTFNNGGAGAASGTTYNGSVARTISYNTIGAPSTTGSGASGTWAIGISGNAATATSAAVLTTPRTIALSGDVSGSASFDGSANITITTTVANDSHTHSNYLLNTSDTMTGTLGVQAVAVGSVSMPSTGGLNTAGNITAFGFISAVGNITTGGGNFQTNTGTMIAGNYVQAGLGGSSVEGTVRLQSSGSGNSGWVEFLPGNDIRAGYIGSSGATGSTDGGGINYVSGFHAFTGNMTVTGNITAQGNVTAYSDRRIKENIQPIENALDKVMRIDGVSYNRIGKSLREVGVIAQNVREVLPEVVFGHEDHLSVAYGNMVALLVEAIKEQQRQIDGLKAQLNK